MLDVLHHIEFPLKFFREAARVVKPGGRVITIDPAITPASSAFYRFIHHEPVIMRADPLRDGDPDPKRDPYASNQAIPTILATRDRARLAAAIPELRLRKAHWFAFAAYPLSGGFQRWSLLTPGMAKQALKLERVVEKPLGRLLGFRVLLEFQRV